MFSFITKLLFLMLIVCYSSQYGFSVLIVIFLYCIAMIVNIVKEAAVRLKVEELSHMRTLSLEDSLTMDFLCRDVSLPIIWTVFFTFMNVIYIVFALALPWFSIIVAISGLNSIIHLQYLEKSKK